MPALNRRRTPVRTFGTVAVAVALSGCALFDPHIRIDNSVGASKDAQGAPTPPPQLRDLTTEKQRAYKFADDLETAASEHSWLRNGTALTLVPMSAAALYKGTTTATDGGQKLITKLAIAGAAIFGLSEYFYSPQRQRVYLEGRRTTLCIVSSMEPFVLSPQDHATLLANVSILETESAGAKVSIGKIEDKITSVGLKEEPAIRDYVASAKVIVDSATSTSEAGRALLGRADHAGNELYNRIQDLAVQIDLAVVSTEPDLASIKTIFAAMAAAAKPPAPTSTPSTPGGTPGTGGQNNDKLTQEQVDAATVVRNALQELSAHLQRIVTASAKVNGILKAVAEVAKNSAQTSQCKLATVNTFDVEPSDDSISVDIPSTTIFAISGGTGAIRVTLGGAQSDKVTAVATNSGGSNIVTLKVDTGAKAGAYKLMISDSTDANTKKIAVTVKSSSSTPQKSSPGGASTPGNDKTLTVDEMKTLQKAIGMTGSDIDGLMGPKTQAKIVEYKKQNGLKPEDGSITDELWKKVTAQAPTTSTSTAQPTGPQLSADDIADVQAKLKQKKFLADTAPISRTLDDATKAAIKAYQKSRKEPETGVLTDKQLKALLGN